MVWWHIGDVTGEEVEIPGCRLADENAFVSSEEVEMTEDFDLQMEVWLCHRPILISVELWMRRQVDTGEGWLMPEKAGWCQRRPLYAWLCPAADAFSIVILLFSPFFLFFFSLSLSHFLSLLFFPPHDTEYIHKLFLCAKPSIEARTLKVHFAIVPRRPNLILIWRELQSCSFQLPADWQPFSTPVSHSSTRHLFCLFFHLFWWCTFELLDFQFEPSDPTRETEEGPKFGKILTTINTVFTVLYTLEFLLKLAAFGKVGLLVL